MLDSPRSSNGTSERTAPTHAWRHRRQTTSSRRPRHPRGPNRDPGRHRHPPQEAMPLSTRPSTSSSCSPRRLIRSRPPSNLAISVRARSTTASRGTCTCSSRESSNVGIGKTGWNSPTMAVTPRVRTRTRRWPAEVDALRGETDRFSRWRNSVTADRVTEAYAMQLEAQGEWHWAAFVLLHIELPDRYVIPRCVVAHSLSACFASTLGRPLSKSNQLLFALQQAHQVDSRAVGSSCRRA
jgi:hypothetical protein